MFGFKASDESLVKLVQQKKWDKIKRSYLGGDTATQISLAAACATSVSDDSVNVLTALLEVPDDSVKIAALKALATVGNDHCVTQVQHLLTGLSADQTELKAQIQETLNALRGKR